MLGFFITCLIYFSSYYVVIQRIYSAKNGSKKESILIMIYALIFSIIASQEQVYLIRAIGVFLVFTFLILSFDMKKYIAILLAVLFYLLIAISEWTFMIFNSSFHVLDTTNSNSISYVIGSVIVSLIFTIFIFIFSNLISILKDESYPPFKWLLLVFPFVTIGLIFLIPDYYEMIIEHKALTILLLGLIFSNFIMLYFYTYSIKAIHLDSELTMIKSKQKYLEEKVQLVNQHYTHSFNYLHRFLHECNDLNYFVETKDMDNIAALAKKMGEEAGKEFNMIYSNSLALNTVLQQKNDKIQELNVSIMTTILCDLKDMELSDQIELYEILLNHALDNCKQFDVNNRQIRIVLKEINSNIAIQMISPNQDKEDMVENILKDMIKKYSMRYNRKVEEDKEMILLLL